MEIIIPLPESSLANTYKELMGYLKQLELAVHHAQKAVENAEKSGIEITEDTFIEFIHPRLKSSLELDVTKEETDSMLGADVLKNFVDNYYEELQNVELRINLQ